MGKIYIGTSGYSYRDWVGPLYSAGSRAKDYLSQYARRFEFTELNFPYYKMPEKKQIERILDTARSENTSFSFSIKAHKSMTHERPVDRKILLRDCDLFRNALEPLVSNSALLAVLLQFPFSFHYSDDNRRYLSELITQLQGLPIAVEFRCRDWLIPSVFRGLEERGTAFVNVDVPELPGLPTATAQVTSDIAYLRFHGRNNTDWWQGDNTSRYDYRYSIEELSQWRPALKEMQARSRILVVAFNNHAAGKAVRNAEELHKILID
ncbi:DUF72 domain-containing protein [Spirochaeta dissipatitropha]